MSKRKYAQGILPLKKGSGSGVAQSDHDNAEEFNGQFVDVFNKNDHCQILLDRYALSMENICFQGRSN